MGASPKRADSRGLNPEPSPSGGPLGHGEGGPGVCTSRFLAPSDICVWPDGTWCYQDQLHDMSHMSDDYIVLFTMSDTWAEFIQREGGAA